MLGEISAIYKVIEKIGEGGMGGPSTWLSMPG